MGMEHEVVLIERQGPPIVRACILAGVGEPLASTGRS